MKKAVCILLTALTVSTAVIGGGLTAFAKENPALEDNFDAEFYAEKYPDVVAALGTSEAKLYEHYLTFGKSENRMPNASGTRTTGNSVAAAATKSDYDPSFFAPGDENYLRMAYLANWGSYKIGEKDEWGEGDPALGFTRQDYTQDPFYIRAKAAFLAVADNSKRNELVTADCRFWLHNTDEFNQTTNILKNLAIDLMKSGQIKNVSFSIVSADGCIHLTPWSYEDTISATYNATFLERDDVAAHPEIKGYITKGSTAY